MLTGIGGGLSDLYANLDKVPGLPIRGAKGLPAKLEEHREAAFLSYELATIKVDVPLDIEVEALVCGEPDRDALLALYTEMEFKSWIAEVQRDAAQAGDVVAPPLRRRPRSSPSTKPFSTRRASTSGSTSCARRRCSPSTPRPPAWTHSRRSWSACRSRSSRMRLPMCRWPMTTRALRRNWTATAYCWRSPLLEDPAKGKIGQNAKYDINILANCALGGDPAQGIQMRGVSYDTMLESYVLDSTATRHDMDSLALKYRITAPSRSRTSPVKAQSS